MLVCAGILFRAPSGACLVLRRSGDGDCIGMWDLPGGKAEDGETLMDAALREAREEIGIDFDNAGMVLMRRVVGDVDYTTFIKDVPEPFVPALNDEHNAFAWIMPADALAEQPAEMVPQPIEAEPMANVPVASQIEATRPRADAEFRETDHPRATDGKFGSGSKVRIVTSHDPDTGETKFHHVGGDQTAAQDAFEAVSNDDDIAYEPELHEAKIRGGSGGRSDTLHIVHSGDGVAGVNIHGAHLVAGTARQQAHIASQAEWEENGPRRSEAGLSDLEKVDLAHQWNDDHASDHDDVRVKIDDDGDPILDDEGDFQFVQDDEDVEPGDETREAFDAVLEQQYPGVDVAAFPGLDEANDHFESEGRHEAVFRVHEHGA